MCRRAVTSKPVERTGHPPLCVGEVLTARRTVVVEGIAAFTSLVGDEGRHHVSADGPVVAHGLLTASLATRIGGWCAGDRFPGVDSDSRDRCDVGHWNSSALAGSSKA